MRNATWIICTALCLAPAAASADTTTTTSTDGLGLTKADFNDLLFSRKVGDAWEYMNKTTFDNFFNRKRCECNEEVKVRVTLQTTPATRAKINGKMGTIKLRAGDDTCVCQGSACTGSLCRTITPEQDIAGLLNNNLEFTFKVRELFAAGRAETTDPATICDRDDNQNLYVWVDGPDADSTTDVTDAATQIKLDGVGPPAPTGISAVGGEEALQVSWNQIALLSDFQGYQVLCSRGNDLQVFKDPPGARFESAAACEANNTTTSDGGTTTSDGGATDAGSSDGSTSARLVTTTPESATSQTSQELAESGPAPPALAALNPAFVCSDLLTSGTSTRLYQLQNGIRYVVGVVAVDLRGNPSKLTQVVAETPIQTRDFYNGYRRAGGAAEGGYCAFASGAANSGTTSAARTWWAALGLGLAAAGLRRRRKRGPRGQTGEANEASEEERIRR